MTRSEFLEQCRYDAISPPLEDRISVLAAQLVAKIHNCNSTGAQRKLKDFLIDFTEEHVSNADNMKQVFTSAAKEGKQ